MSTRRLDDLLPQVLPHAVGCPTVYALQCLRRAAIEWCERTRCWRHQTEFTMAAQDHVVVVPDYASIYEIEQAEWNGKELSSVQFSETTADDRGVGGRGNPYAITQSAPGSVMLIPFQPGTVALSLFLKPKHGTSYDVTGASPFHDTLNVLPSPVFEQDADHIAHGGLQRILSTPGKEWTNIELAGWFDSQFERAASSRQTRSITGQQRAPLRTVPRWF